MERIIYGCGFCPQQLKMNWKALYREPKVGSKVKVIDDSSIKDLRGYPKNGDIVKIVAICGREYYFTKYKYLFRNEFKVVL